MNTLRCLLCLLLLAGAACRKRPAPVEPPPAPAAEPKDVPVDVALHHLNTAVRNYYAEILKLPASLDEVYAAGYLKERFNPPAGRQFVINQQSRAVEVR